MADLAAGKLEVVLSKAGSIMGVEDGQHLHQYDVVEVSGLGGMSSAHESGNGAKSMPWLRNLLPDRIQDLRVLSFTYRLQLENGIIISDIERHAVGLLRGLQDLASDSHRRIVFVGHDIGGTIIKTALSIAVATDEYSPLAKRVSLLVFFATPHRGREASSWEKLACRLILTTEDQNWGPLSRALKPTSRTLMELSHEFHPISRLYSMVNLVEDSNKPVVDDFSATLPLPKVTTISKKEHHQTICDFTAKADSAFKTICDQIESSESPDSNYIDCLRALLALSRHHFLPVLPSGDRSLFSWVKAHTSYQSWIDGSGGVLVVRGRSRLERKMAFEYIKSFILDAKPSEAIIYFSFDPDDRRDMSVFRLLASLCYQLLCLKPQLFDHISRLYAYMRDASDWTDDLLWVFFRSLLSCPHHGSTFCLVEGINLSSSELRYIDELLSLPSTKSPAFKLVISKEEEVQIRLPTLTIDLEHDSRLSRIQAIDPLLRAEVAAFVEESPGYGWARDILGVKFNGELHEDNGTSPWATMARSKLILSLLGTSQRPHTKAWSSQLLELIPDNLNALYRELLQEIDGRYRCWARAALSWMARAIRPLSLVELAVASNLYPRWLSVAAANDVVSQDLDRDLQRAFGNLITTKGRNVHFIHRSLKDFLLSGHHGHCHEVCLECCEDDDIIADDCLAYLSLLSSHSQLSPAFRRGHTGGELQYSLVDYASQYWAVHHKRARTAQGPNSRVDFKQYFEDENLIQAWSECFWNLQDPALRGQRATPIRIAAEVGCLDLLECLLNKTGPGDEAASQALQVAIANGENDMASLLLSRGVRSRTSLHIAASRGRENFLSLLREYEVDLDGTDSEGMTPLHLAAQNGHVGMMERLLQSTPRPNIAAMSKEGLTPLHMASQFGHVEVVRRLIEELIKENADLNPPSGVGAGPLHVACEWQQPGAAALILEALTLEGVAATDGHKRNALHLASKTGRVDIVQSIIDRLRHLKISDEDLSQLRSGQDNEYWTPLHLAAAGGHDLVVEVLLDDINSAGGFEEATSKQDKHGSTPLHLAADKGHAKVTKQLLEKDWSQIRTLDHNHSAPIHLGAARGNVEVMESLCEEHAAHDISLNMVNFDSLGPLHLASKNNHPGVVKILLRKGAKADIADYDGETPLLTASRRGLLDIVRFLIDAGADITSTNNEESSALHLASKPGHTDVVLALLEAAKGQAKAQADGNQYSDMVDSKGRTALLLAVESGHAQIVQALCEKGGASLNITDKRNLPLLHLAAKENHLAVVKYLVTVTGADVGVKDIHSQNSTGESGDESCSKREEHEESKRRTALHWAVESGSLDIVKALLEPVAGQQANSTVSIIVNAADGEGQTSLHLASKYGYLDIVKYLLGRGADPKARNEQDLSTPMTVAASDDTVLELLAAYKPLEKAEQDAALFLAASQGYDRVIEKLLEIGGDELSLDITDSDSRTPLILAASNGHAGVVRLLLNSGRDVLRDHSDTNGRTALSYACEGHGEISGALLLPPGVRVDTADNGRRTPLSYAADTGVTDIVSKLLQILRSAPSPTHAHEPDTQKRTPLWYASEKGRDAVVKILLDGDGDPNFADGDGMTPLHIAAKVGHVDVVSTLLGSKKITGANAKTSDKRTALFCASDAGHQAVVKILLESEEDPNIGDDEGMTPLHVAARAGHTEVVRELLRSGKVTDPNAMNQSRRTPLWLAAYFGNKEVVRILVDHLIENGLAIDVQGRWGWRPLHAAYDNPDVTRMLLEPSKAEVDAQDEDGKTALYLAVELGYESVAQELLRHKASPLVKSNNGKTPFYLACESFSKEMVQKMLQEINSGIDIKDNNGDTVLMAAVGSGRSDVVKLLLEREELVPTITQRNNKGITTIKLAVMKNEIAVVEALTSKVDAKMLEGLVSDGVAVDLLMLAAEKGSTELLDLLFKKLGDIPKPDGILGELITTAKDVGTGSLESLMEKMRGFRTEDGFDEDKTDSHGWTLRDLLTASRSTPSNNDRPKNMPRTTSDSFKPPESWNTDDKSEVLELDDKNPLSVRYRDSTAAGWYVEAGCIRADHPIPPTKRFYFEMRVVQRGDGGRIAIGFGRKDAALDERPGLNPDSWGYHAEDGCIFHASDNIVGYELEYGTDDVVGCCIDPIARTAFFTCNGYRQEGHLIESVTGRLFPMVALKATGAEILVNFGRDLSSTPFVYDGPLGPELPNELTDEEKRHRDIDANNP